MGTMYRQKWGFLAEQKARYALMPIVGIWVFISLLTHDASIYSAIELGEADSGALSELYFEYWNHETNRNIGAGMFFVMGFLVVYAVIIRIAQKKVEKAGYSA